MTRDDIINMAKEAWGLEYVSEFDVPKLERFAALVAEACAVICDELSEDVHNAADCASAIRARTTP